MRPGLFGVGISWIWWEWGSVWWANLRMKQDAKLSTVRLWARRWINCFIPRLRKSGWGFCPSVEVEDDEGSVGT